MVIEPEGNTKLKSECIYKAIYDYCEISIAPGRGILKRQGITWTNDGQDIDNVWQSNRRSVNSTVPNNEMIFLHWISKGLGAWNISRKATVARHSNCEMYVFCYRVCLNRTWRVSTSDPMTPHSVNSWRWDILEKIDFYDDSTLYQRFG